MIYMTVVFLLFNGVYLKFKGKTLIEDNSKVKGFKRTFLIFSLVNFFIAIFMFDLLTSTTVDEIPTFTGLEAVVFVFLLFMGIVLVIRYFYHKFYQKKESFRQEILYFMELLIYFSFTVFAYSTLLLSFTIYIIYIIG